MTRKLILASLVFVYGCGGDDGGGAVDAAVDEQLDAAPPDAAPVCPELEPGAGDGFEACNPVTQEGCDDREKCTRLASGATGCAADGTVAVGEACERDDTSDDCAAGGLCLNDRCRAICTLQSDSCCSGFACSSYASTFSDDTNENTGVCSARCDPVAQDCADPLDGCYLEIAKGVATCTRTAPDAQDLTQGETCSNNGSQCYLNGCAEGYGGHLFAGAGMPRICTAFCTPIDTYLVDPDGDGEGELAAGSDPDGAAAADCGEERIGAPGHQCRFFQTYFTDQNGEPLDHIPAAYGMCAPAGATHGDCAHYSAEWMAESYNDFIEGGGTVEDWPDHIGALCAEEPYRCASGCVTAATREALNTAYCDLPANATRPSCVAR